MLRKILLALAVAVIGFLVVVATRPAEFTIQRSAVIGAAPSVIYPHLSDFHQWNGWSPWAALDPAQTLTYGGPPTGVGATYAWAGNDKVGQGRMEIIDAKPDELVRIRLDFEKPFQATNTTTFELHGRSSGGTLVVWRMEGKNNFIAKAMSMFMDMDKMVGGDFERGLSMLKTQTEADAAAHPAPAAQPSAPAKPSEDAPSPGMPAGPAGLGVPALRPPTLN